MRYSGFKGVLVAHPGLESEKTEGEASKDPDLPLIAFRKSMQKFDGQLNELSVIRCSTYSPAFLNRQVILLLSNLGVQDDLFLKRNSRALKNLNAEEAIARMERKAFEIRKQKDGDSKEILSEDQLKKRDEELLDDLNYFFGPSRQFKNIFKRALLMSVKYRENKDKAAFKLTEEPIFSSIINNMVLGQSFTLRSKARIFMRDACVLIGVAEIDGRLERIGIDSPQQVKLASDIDFS